MRVSAEHLLPTPRGPLRLGCLAPLLAVVACSGWAHDVTHAGATDPTPTGTDVGQSQQEPVLAVSESHACLLDAGHVWCWGDNSAGQLGAAGGAVAGATELPHHRAVIDLAVGIGATCICDDHAEVHCWGFRQSRLEAGDPPSHRRVAVPPCVGVGAGMRTGCSLSESGEVHCWGSLGTELETALSDDRSAERPLVGARSPGHVWQDEPVRIGQLEGATILRMDAMNACVASPDAIRCWGSNWGGQLANGPRVDGMVVIPLPAGVTVRDVSPGLSHVCAAFSGGEISCWGLEGSCDRASGRPSDQELARCSVPRAVAGLPSDAVRLDAGHARTCALTVDHAVVCWGRPFGGTTPSLPTTIAEDVRAFATSFSAACLLGFDGAVRCWGEGESWVGPPGGVVLRLDALPGGERQ